MYHGAESDPEVLATKTVEDEVNTKVDVVDEQKEALKFAINQSRHVSRVDERM